jgi:hypothetical protein
MTPRTAEGRVHWRGRHHGLQTITWKKMRGILIGAAEQESEYKTHGWLHSPQDINLPLTTTPISCERPQTQATISLAYLSIGVAPDYGMRVLRGSTFSMWIILLLLLATAFRQYLLVSPTPPPRQGRTRIWLQSQSRYPEDPKEGVRILTHYVTTHVSSSGCSAAPYTTYVSLRPPSTRVEAGSTSTYSKP